MSEAAEAPEGDPSEGSDDDSRTGKRGLILMLAATACFVGMAAFVKLLREDGLGTAEVMTWRVLPSLPVVWLAMRRKGQRLWPEVPRLILLRSLFGLLAMAGYFYALRALTMVENAILHLLQPVFVAVLSPMILDERLRRSAIVALVLGLLGALVALRPDQALDRQIPLGPMLAGVAAALFSGLAHMMVRKATLRDTPERVVFWFTALVSAGGLFVGLALGEFQGLPPGLSLPKLVLEIVAMSGLGLLGQLLMTRAYGRSAAPMVALVAYATIPLSVVLDLLAWGVAPGIEELVGSAMMVVAGLLLARGR